MGRAKSLGLSYTYDPENAVLRFEDGVDYTAAEALSLSRPGIIPADLRAIHRVKKAFDGEILTGPAEQPPRGLVNLDDKKLRSLSALQVSRGAALARYHRGESSSYV